MSVSVDGFMEAANGDIGWSAPNPELHQHFNDLESAVDAFLYGRRLYENMAAYWPTADQNPAAPKQEKEYARIWRNKPKIVFSTTLHRVEWNSRLVKGDIAQEVRKLKVQPGNELTVGGAGLAASFMQLGLIDEYWLYVHPVTLGGGKPMFGPLQNQIDLQLLDTRRFGQGVILLRYQAG
jgi:dihydrofolate reductase